MIEEWAQMQEVCNLLEYIITGEALVIWMFGSLRGHEILLDDIPGTKKTWCQGVRNNLMLDNTP